MSHPNHETFSVEIPLDDPKKMEEFQNFMDGLAEAHERETERISVAYGCSFHCATDILYLRSRSRWSQELENQLVEYDKQGKHPPVLAGWSGETEDKWNLI